MKTKKEQSRFVLTDHACRSCGGRILQQPNSGPSGGGNPYFRCADCGKGGCHMGTDHLCWCGFGYKGAQPGRLRCVSIARAREDPALYRALSANGFWLETCNVEIGVFSEDSYRRANEEDSA
jgi:hypothetical protein